ncbi:MAG: stage V sporulation protein AA [Alkaliphilus sp.]
MDESQIFIQSKGKICVEKTCVLSIKELIEIVADRSIKESIGNIKFLISPEHKKNCHVVSIFAIVKLIKNEHPKYFVSVVGDTDVFISFEDETKKNDMFKFLRAVLVSSLLLIGAITAIINFHADVDMKDAQQTMYRLITGEETESLLLLQIPYGLGVGLGMSVFFNHIFNRKINSEPSPMEVEMYLYQQNIDECMKNTIEDNNE